MNCNLNQSDEKSDQPGILGLDDPLFLCAKITFFQKLSFSREIRKKDNWGEFPDFKEFTLVIIFVNFTQKWQFRLENENLERIIKSKNPWLVGFFVRLV